MKQKYLQVWWEGNRLVHKNDIPNDTVSTICYNRTGANKERKRIEALHGVITTENQINRLEIP